MQRAATVALDDGEDFVALQVERARTGRDIVVRRPRRHRPRPLRRAGRRLLSVLLRRRRARHAQARPPPRRRGQCRRRAGRRVRRGRQRLHAPLLRPRRRAGARGHRAAGGVGGEAMTAFVALLRAVNVGGTGIIRMAASRRSARSSASATSQTLLQSGNVVFTAKGTRQGRGRRNSPTRSRRATASARRSSSAPPMKSPTSIEAQPVPGRGESEPEPSAGRVPRRPARPRAPASASPR